MPERKRVRAESWRTANLQVEPVQYSEILGQRVSASSVVADQGAGLVGSPPGVAGGGVVEDVAGQDGGGHVSQASASKGWRGVRAGAGGEMTPHELSAP